VPFFGQNSKPSVKVSLALQGSTVGGFARPTTAAASEVGVRRGHARLSAVRGLQGSSGVLRGCGAKAPVTRGAGAVQNKKVKHVSLTRAGAPKYVAPEISLRVVDQ